MGVVTKYGSGYKDPAAILNTPAVLAEGTPRAITSVVAIANGNSATSQVFLGRVPSNAIILPQSLLTHTAITGLTDLDVGLYRNGSVVDADVLADGLDVHLAGTKSPIASVGTADLGKRVWELAGLTSDPGGMYDVVATLKADAGADGTLVLSLIYART